MADKQERMDPDNMFARMMRSHKDTQEKESESSGRPESSSGVPGVDKGERKRRRTRKKTGKRSNPDYEQYAIYIHKSVRQAVDAAIREIEEDGGKIEHSALVESLLSRWLEEMGHSVES